MARIILGVTGSVAAVRTPELHRELKAAGHVVKVVATAAALHFFRPQALAPLGDGSLPVRGQDTLYRDEDEWRGPVPFRVGAPVLHIELRRWADLLVIAPLDANTLGKLALGLCDNLLTSLYRAWDRERPILIAPAMNTLMWDHPVCAEHLRALLRHHCPSLVEPSAAEPDALSDEINSRCARLRIVPPVSKRLACGDEGVGGMAEVPALVLAVWDLLATVPLQRDAPDGE